MTLGRRFFSVKQGFVAVALLVGSGCDSGDEADLDGIEDLDEPSGVPEVGQRSDPSEIYGGTIVPSCGWPATVSLGGSCTGTLIHPEVVIYAAHCGSNYKSIRFGENISSGAGFSVPTQFCKTYPGGGPGKGNDFAFCKLAQPVTGVPIVPALMGCETSVLQPKRPVRLVGFGNADNGPYGYKREVSTTINSISSKNECHIGGGGKDSCQGDSGGPAFVQLDDGSWRVFGITSYGGACGGGGYYSMMHIGMAWFESASGVDLTPCHDADGTWNPSDKCTGFPVNPWQGSSNWAGFCGGGSVSGESASCGAPFGGTDSSGSTGGVAEAPTGDVYKGSLTGKGDSEVQPNGKYYTTTKSGTHIGKLTGATGTDFDLYLFRWNGKSWTQVASGATSSSSETVAFEGTAGHYAWLISSYSGAGSYTLTSETP